MKASNVRWRIFSLLALSSFVSYVLRANISIAAPTMRSELGLTEIEWGWVVAAFVAGYAMFQFPGGMFGDKAGPRKALTAIAILWGVLMASTALVPGIDAASTTVIIISLVAVRFFVGAAHAPIFPVMNTAIVRWFPVGGWALPLGLSSTALTLGYAAAAPVITWLIIVLGWRYAFLILSPLGFIVAALWWWYARDRPSEHAAVNIAELELIGNNEETVAVQDVASPAWYDVLRNRNVLLLMLSYSCMNFVFYEVFSWFHYYLVDVRMFDPTTAGFVTSSQWIAGGAGAALGGWLCDRMCSKLGLRWGCRWPVVLGMLTSGAMLLIGAFHSNAAIAVTMLALCFFFNQLTEGTYWATSIAVGKRMAGTVGGVMNTGANIIGVLNAILVPWFAHVFSWEIALASGAAFALLGAILMLFVRSDQAIEDAKA